MMIRRLMLVLLLTAFGPSLVTASAGLRLDPVPATVPQRFILSGNAVGVDTIHVWAWPATGPVFLGATQPTLPDRITNSSTGAFSLAVTSAPIGTYPVVAYARDPETGGFDTQIVVWLSVRACEWVIECYPFAGPAGPMFVFMHVCR